MPTGLIVGGWFASTAVTKLINGLIDYAKDQKKMQLGLKDELKRLEEGLPKIQAVVNAVDQGLIKEKNPALETWLWQLRDAADQADDVMDEMEYNFIKEKVEVGKNKVSKAISNFKAFLERAVYKDPFLKRLIVAVKAIDRVASSVGLFYSLVQDLAKNQKEMVKSAINSRETSSILNIGNCVGRDKEKEDIITKLLNPVFKVKEMNFAVLPIIGAGGIGKTTLAQVVYNDSVVEKHFELRVWVCVSNNFDAVLLTKMLYESVFKTKADFDNFDLIQRQLKDELTSKRFLVVFDDAWNDADSEGWKKLFAPLRSGKSGSMILLTTRMETVARLTGPNLMDFVYLEGLDERDMWNLFEECAFGGEDPNDYTELVEIGKGIVKKLKGNPLAARTVGGALYSDLTEIHWRSILKSELWSPEQGTNGIMPALRLSYQHLPSHLKPCFSFCSIFPQDHIFIKDDLIYMWLALGLVPRDFNGARKPEDVGSVYFENMLKRSLFTPTDSFDIRTGAHISYLAHASISGKKITGGYIMHDLMHDLSTFISQGECFRYDTSKSIPIPTTVRHLYIRVGDCYEWSNFNFKNIRTLIVQLADSYHLELVYILNRMLKGMRSLRILKLIAPRLSEVPERVGDLLHLCYWSSNSYMLDGFPKSMSRLFLLETIVTSGFKFDKEAEGLVKLNNLRHIIASQHFIETIANIGRLTSLQELCFRVGKDSGFKISELGDMRELRFLSISNINDVNSHEEAKQANLKKKVDLRILSLQWGTENCERKIFDEMVLDHLEPNCNLKELIIRSYMGGRLPVWESESLSSLVKLEISSCHNLISLDEGLLRNSEKMVALKELIIQNCKELKMPKEGFRRFISLQRLDVSGCPNIKIFDVLVFCPPSKLRFLYINGYVDNGLERNSYVNDFIGNLNENFMCESKLEQDPTSYTEQANILVLDHPVESSNLEMRLLRLRDYIGRWPPIWLTKPLTMLEYLCIDGGPHTYQYHSNYEMDQLLKIIRLDLPSRGFYPSLEIANPSNMPAPEQIFLAMQHIKYIQYIKKLTISLSSKSFVMPPLPPTLEHLRLHYLGLMVLPNICENQGRESKSLPSLVSMKIKCPNLVSLAEGLQPQQLAALECLTIHKCSKLRNLPEGAFSKFISLKKLDIRHCRSIEGQLLRECFLPRSLQRLCIESCGDLDATLTKALESVQSLISLELYDCKNIRSLPPKEVFSRWKALEKLKFVNCDELTSLESLLGLSFVRLLKIRGCPKLVSAITSPSAGKKDEIEGMVEGGTIQTSNRPASTHPTTTDPSSSTNTERKPLFFVDELIIDDPLLLSIEPIRSLSSVRMLTIEDCSEMQSLPELPPIIEELSLGWYCSPELERRCKKSGQDWPKLSHIPKVFINGDGRSR